MNWIHRNTRGGSALALVACALGLALIVAGLSGVRAARAATAGQLQQQIGSSQNRVNALSGAVQSTGSRLSQLNSSISVLQARISSVQTALDSKRAALATLTAKLGAARVKLAQLQAFQARAEQALSSQLVSSYESQPPSLVTVVLEAKGFQDLLDRLSFEERIRNQDVQIVTRVRSTRKAVAAEAVSLGALEVRAQALTDQVLGQRNSLAQARLNLVQQQIAVARAHSARAGQLAVVRGHLGALQARLSRIRAQQAAAVARAALRAAGLPSSGSVTPTSAGGFTFPLPKSAVVGPGSWTLDQGVDMAAPGDTPEFAVCSGTVVLHGIGGFGPWAPVLHCDSPLGGYSYVYYGHAGPNGELPVGTHVSAGQVIGSIGPGIVGMSTGPHIEIGFSDSSGTPVGTGSASTMMSFLQASYAA
ncbi:MAG: murein hydrolase activator EnvC family protein [Solirubrobacteraceae bacterium]